MTSQSGQLQALIAEIEALLNKAAPRLPWVMSGEASEQRRIMEQALTYLQEVQAAGALSPAWALTTNAAEAIAPVAGEPTDVAETNSQQVLQALLQEMQYLRVQMVQPLTNEVMALQQQREALKNEVRQLELERLQQLESAPAQSLNPAWMDDVVGRLSAVLLEQLTPQFRALRSQIEGGPALYEALPPDAAEVAADLPQLNPQQRLEQLRQIQAQTDHLLLRLDANLRTVFESLDQSIQSYCDTLNQGLDAMHGLGQQGEFVFRTFINHLAEQLQDESSYLISRPGQARLTGHDRATQDSPVRSADSGFSDSNLDALDLSNVDLSAVDEAVEADEEVTLFQLDEELTDLPVDDLEDDLDEMPEWVEPDPGEATMVQTEPIPWEVVTGQTAAAVDAPAEATDTDAYTEEIDSLYDSLFGNPVAPSSTADALDETDDEAIAADSEPLFTLDQLPEPLEPTPSDSSLPGAETIAPAEPVETALESLFAATEPTLQTDEVATTVDPPAALENLLGSEIAEELAPVVEAQNESDDIITSLSELLPTSEPGQSAQAADPFATFEESEDTFIAAPPEENLLDAPVADSGTTLDFTLDEATLGQLTSDLSQLEGFAVSMPEWPIASTDETATTAPASQAEVGWTSADNPSLAEEAIDGDGMDGAQDVSTEPVESLALDDSVVDDRELPEREPEAGPMPNTVEVDLGSDLDGLFVDEPEIAAATSLDSLVSDLTSEPSPSLSPAIADDLDRETSPSANKVTDDSAAETTENGPDAWLADLDLDGLDAELDADLPVSGDPSSTPSAPLDAAEAIALDNIFGDDEPLSSPVLSPPSETDIAPPEVAQTIAEADDRGVTIADAFGSETDDWADPLSDVSPENSSAAALDAPLTPPASPTTEELALTLEDAIPLELELPDFSESLLEIASEAADGDPAIVADIASITLDDDLFPDDNAQETASSSPPPVMPANSAAPESPQDWSKYVSDEPDADSLFDAVSPKVPEPSAVSSDAGETAEDFLSLGDLDLDLSLDLDVPVSDSETISTAAELFADFPDDPPAPSQTPLPPTPTLPLTGSVSDGSGVEVDTTEAEQTLANLIAAIPEKEGEGAEAATTAEFAITTGQNEDEALSAALDNLSGLDVADLDVIEADQTDADSNDAEAIAPFIPELDESIEGMTDPSDPVTSTAGDGFWTPEMEEQMAADFAAASASTPDSESTPDDVGAADSPGPLSDDELANLFPPQTTDDTVTVAPLDNLEGLFDDGDDRTVPASLESSSDATPEEESGVDATSEDPLTFLDDDSTISSSLGISAGAIPEEESGGDTTSEDPLTFLPEDTDFVDVFPSSDEETPALDVAPTAVDSAAVPMSLDADLINTTPLSIEGDTLADSELDADLESIESGAASGIDWDPMEADFEGNDDNLTHELDTEIDEAEGFAASPLFDPLEPSPTEIFPDAENSDQTKALDSPSDLADDDIAPSPLFEPLDLSMEEIPAADLERDEAFRSAFEADLDLTPATTAAAAETEAMPDTVDAAVTLDSDGDRGEDAEASTLVTDVETELTGELGDEVNLGPPDETTAVAEDSPVIAREPVPTSPLETPTVPEIETVDESLEETADESLFASSGQLAAIPIVDPDEPDAAVESDSGLIEEWFLGLDFGAGGLSAVLMEQGSGTAHPLCWLAESEADNPGAATFRLATVAAFQPSASDQGAQSELLAVGPAALSQQPPDRPETWLLQGPRSLLRVGMPYQTAEGAWEPVIQWADAQTVSLQQVLAAVTGLLSLIHNPGELALHLTAVGLEDEMLSDALASLQGVVLGLPSNWSDTYCLNIREAVLGADLVDSSSQIFFVEEAIAAVLSGLPDPNEPPPESNRQTQTLYQCNWQGGTVVISSGATCTEVGIVDLPQPLDTLSREDFKLRNLAYGGDALDLDIICQLLVPAERRQTVTPNANRQARDGWSWQATLPEVINAHWDDLHLESLDLPQLAEPDNSARIRLRQQLEATRLGQSLLEAARYLKLILQNQNHYQLELADQSWRVLRRDLESRVLVPYIQRLNQQLNALLSQTGLASQGINQVVCTGGNASFNAIAKWLRQKFPNATIIQDTYPSNRPHTCSRVAYGLANLCRYPQLLDVPRHQYSDYFLLNEMIRTVSDAPMPFEGILHLLEEQGVNTDACQSRIAAILEGHLPPGLRPDASTQDYLSRATLASDTYQELAATALFTKQTRQIYIVNPQQRDRLQGHLAALMLDKQQSLTEPMIAQLVTL